ncbi:MAG: hypothetical protein ORN56_05835 [Chitinophagales bacterium]|nr:hypothetical protein [Chitinophagales bacterium]
MEALETLRRVHKVEVPDTLDTKIEKRIQELNQEEKTLKILLPLLIVAMIGLGYNFYQVKKSNTNSIYNYQTNLSSQLYHE